MAQERHGLKDLQLLAPCNPLQSLAKWKPAGLKMTWPLTTRASGGGLGVRVVRSPFVAEYGSLTLWLSVVAWPLRRPMVMPRINMMMPSRMLNAKKL